MNMRTYSYPIERRLPFEKNRIEEIHELVEQGCNPLSITICSGNECRDISDRDVANYCEQYRVPFEATVSCFELVGEDHAERLRRV